MDNDSQYDEVPKAIRKSVRVHFVQEYREVHKLVFGGGIDIRMQDS